MRERQDRELLRGRGEIGALDAALRLEQVRQVRVAVERDPVGRGGDDLVQRHRELRGALVRKPVDQVRVDRDEPVRPRGVDHGEGLGLALDAVDGLLDVGIEILDAHGDAVEAELAEERDRRRVDLARVDLDGHLGIRGERECAGQVPHQVRHLVAGEERGRAAAPVQLNDGCAALEDRGHGVDLAREIADVLRAAAVVLGDDLVAAAVEADRVAERQVDVQRERVVGALLRAGDKRVDVVRGAEAVVEAVRRGVGGVARARLVVLADEVGVECEVGGGKVHGNGTCNSFGCRNSGRPTAPSH